MFGLKVERKYYLKQVSPKDGNGNQPFFVEVEATTPLLILSKY
jgi:hypothetical protein